MGRVRLVCRLAAKDLKKRPGEAAMLLLAILAATTTLTLGLTLHGETSQPYLQTRTATVGPDIVATSNASKQPVGHPPADLLALSHEKGVVGHSGPYPVAYPVLRVHGRTDAVIAIGRGAAPASIDQPKLTEGRWIHSGQLVVERGFADALDIHVGNSVTLNGQPFRVAGIAVTAAIPSYPDAGFFDSSDKFPNPGLVWLTRTDSLSLFAQSQQAGFVLNLRLANPAGDDAFENNFANHHRSGSAPYLMSWQDISRQNANLVKNEQLLLMVGSWLLGLLAVASLAVLVGGRMAEQTRRVGLLKAVGATPGVVAAVLLAQYLLLALVAAAAGLAAGWLVAPLLTKPSAGLLGTAGASPLTVSAVVAVVAVALAVAVAATLVPAIRGARVSTVRALADSARSPRRRAWLISMSEHLPVPLLLGMRMAARRPRRIVLSVLSIAITVSGVVAVLSAHARMDAQQIAASSGLNNPKTDRENQVMLVITAMLVTLAAVNAVFITRATVQDSKHSSAVTRALGATPGQVGAGLSVAQMLPALVGALLGIAGGLTLVSAVGQGGGQPSRRCRG